MVKRGGTGFLLVYLWTKQLVDVCICGRGVEGVEGVDGWKDRRNGTRVEFLMLLSVD